MTGQRSLKTSEVFTLSLLLLAVFGMSCYLLSGYQAKEIDQEMLIDWDKVKSTYLDYLKDPTPDSAKRLLAALPLDRTENQTGDQSAAISYIYDSYPVLKIKVLGGDRYLTEAVFRLLDYSDGAFAEALNEILGKLATLNPRLFLEFLNKYKNSWFVKIVEYPVYGTGAEKREEILSEWARRIKALKTVKESKFRQVRDECIRLLEEAIKYPPEWLVK